MNHSSRGLLQAFNHRFMLLQHLGIFFFFPPRLLGKTSSFLLRDKNILSSTHLDGVEGVSNKHSGST